MKISEPPKQDAFGLGLGFAMSLCLHGARDQGQTAEERAAAKAEQEEGEVKQLYRKIADALKDHLKSRAWL